MIYNFCQRIMWYGDTFEPEPEVDIEQTQEEIEDLQRELEDVQNQMSKYLKELSI